jgi:ACS family glucarate transporter-like MFS transporter
MPDDQPVDSSPTRYDNPANNPYASPADFRTAPPKEPAYYSSPLATRTRFVVLAFLCALAAILYLDRVCISQALKPIQDELRIKDGDMTWVLMAFTLAYGLFEIPAGRWGDRMGSRTVLTRICLWWSAFTALTGACYSFYMLVAVRFLFGAGEAGAYPNSARILSRWFPDHERGRVQGVLLTASHAGAVVAPSAAAWLIHSTGWRWSFVVFGLVGAVWAVLFFWWFRDEPHEHPAVNQAELEAIGKGSRKAAADHSIPWGKVLSSPSIILLCLTMALASFNSYLYFSWYSKYLTVARGLGNIDAGYRTSIVMAGAAIGTIIGGFIIDKVLLRRGVVAFRIYGGTGYLLAAVALWFAVRSDSPDTSALFTSLSYGCTSMVQPLWWTVMIAASGRNVGALFGLCNMCGMFGAMTSQYMVGTLAQMRQDQGLTGRAAWDPTFDYFVVALVLCAVCWFVMQTKPVDDDTEPAVH